LDGKITHCGAFIYSSNGPENWYDADWSKNNGAMVVEKIQKGTASSEIVTNYAGRCGPKFGYITCDCSGYGKYCNTDKGLCSDNDAHKNAQNDTVYDCTQSKTIASS